MGHKEYKAMAATLYQTLYEESGITIEGFRESCHILGRPGSGYQIDVLV